MTYPDSTHIEIGAQALVDEGVWPNPDETVQDFAERATTAILVAVGQPTKTLDDVWESVERLNERLAPGVTPCGDINGELPGMDVREDDDDDIDTALDAEGVPPTNFGVRITFADGSGYDIDNIDGVQVRDKAHNTFPFGFVEVPNPDGSPSGEWRAGYWSPEDGLYRPFDPVAQPNPNGGW